MIRAEIGPVAPDPVPFKPAETEKVADVGTETVPGSLDTASFPSGEEPKDSLEPTPFEVYQKQNPILVRIQDFILKHLGPDSILLTKAYQHAKGVPDVPSTEKLIMSFQQKQRTQLS